MTQSAKQNETLPAKILLSYGGLMVPLAIVDVPIVIYLPVFYSKEIGIDIGLVGLIFVLARIWDGITDPLIGWLSDKTSSKYGRRKPWVVIGTPLLMISIWFAFNPAPDVGAVYAAFWMFCLFLSTTIVFIPYLSWGAELSSDYDGRNVVVGYREVAGMIGNIAVAAGPVLLLAADAPVREVLFYLLVVTFVLFPLTLAPMAMYLPDPQRSMVSKFSLTKAWGLLSHNRPFRLLTSVVILSGLAFGILNSLAIFLVDEGLGLSDKFFTLFLIEYLSAVALSPVIVYLARRFGKHQVMSGGLTVFTLALLLFAFGPRMNFLFAAIGICFLGCGIVTTAIMSTSILADIVDYDTVSSGEKRAGLYMALYKFASKFSMALGIGIAYGVLDLIGYDAKGGNGEFGIYAIKSVGLGIPALLLLPGIFLIARFPIDKHEYHLIRQKIEMAEGAGAGNE
jgi:GPH family glycoside/pentoside/hexuronide:cation symporter